MNLFGKKQINPNNPSKVLLDKILAELEKAGIQDERKRMECPEWAEVTMSEKIAVKTNKVGRSIRATIPASVRAGLGIAAGTVLNVSRVGKKIVFELP